MVRDSLTPEVGGLGDRIPSTKIAVIIALGIVAAVVAIDYFFPNLFKSVLLTIYIGAANILSGLSWGQIIRLFGTNIIWRLDPFEVTMFLGGLITGVGWVQHSYVDDIESSIGDAEERMTGQREAKPESMGVMRKTVDPRYSKSVAERVENVVAEYDDIPPEETRELVERLYEESGKTEAETLTEQVEAVKGEDWTIEDNSGNPKGIPGNVSWQVSAEEFDEQIERLAPERDDRGYGDGGTEDLIVSLQRLVGEGQTGDDWVEGLGRVVDTLNEYRNTVDKLDNDNYDWFQVEKADQRLRTAVNDLCSKIPGALDGPSVSELRDKVQKIEREKQKLEDDKSELSNKVETLKNKKEQAEEKASNYDTLAREIDSLSRPPDSVEKEAKEIGKMETVVNSLIENIDDRWLEKGDSKIQGLVWTIKDEDVGPRIVRTAAQDAQASMSKSAQSLLSTLEAPTDEDTVRRDIEAALVKLGEYDDMMEELNTTVSAGPEETIADVREVLGEIRGPAPVGEEIVSQYEGHLQNLSADGAQLEWYSVEQGIDELETAVTEVRSPDATAEEWSAMTGEFEELRSILEDLMQPGRNGIKRGHMVGDVFVDVAKRLHDRASASHRDGNEDRAEALIEAAVEVLRGVKELYDDREIREFLQ